MDGAAYYNKATYALSVQILLHFSDALKHLMMFASNACIHITFSFCIKLCC